MKYKFIPGDGNDEVSLWVNPPLSGAEPDPDHVTTSGVDADSLGGIVLSQITASNMPPNALIDGIRITTQWEDIPSAIYYPLIKTANKYVLEQNYPNPFNPSTKIKISLPKSEYVSIEIYNTLGQRVETLLSKRLNAGNHEVDFMAHDLAAGLYYYILRTNEIYRVKKMILLK